MVGLAKEALLELFEGSFLSGRADAPRTGNAEGGRSMRLALFEAWYVPRRRTDDWLFEEAAKVIT